MNSDFWREQFELGARSPSAWALEGRRLRRAALLIFDAYVRDLEAMRAGRSALELVNLETADAATLLYGSAFENVLKAIIVQAEGVRIEDGKLVDWPGHHNLIELARRAGVPLDGAQRDIFSRLTASVEWSGRYPIPKIDRKLPLKQVVVSPEWVPLPLQPHELSAVSELYDALEARVLVRAEGDTESPR